MKIFSTLITLVLGVATVVRTDDVTRLAEKVAQVFTSRVFPEVLKEQQKYGRQPNVLLSGFSLLQPLAQLTLASQGDSHEELLTNTLGLTDDDEVKSVVKVYKELFGKSQDTLKTANKLYVSVTTKINETYANESTNLFGTELGKLNFSNAEEAAEEINDYVEYKTNHKIKNLVNPDELGPKTEVVFVNTLYFKSEWEKKFPRVYTKSDDFFYDEGFTVQKEFMLQVNSYKHGVSHDLDAELLQLNYKAKGFYFNIALPKTIKGLPALLEKYKKYDGNLYVENNKFQNRNVQLYLPKFEAEAYTNLIPVLKSLGVHKLFENNSENLRNLLLVRKLVKVTNAVQKVYINVDEKGTEAAAANDVVVNGTAVNTDVVFKANHPFYYEVNYYGYTLFSGTVVFEQRHRS